MFFYLATAMPPEKADPLFPSNPIQKVNVLSSPLFLKNCLEAQPTSPHPLQEERVHTMEGHEG